MIFWLRLPAASSERALRATSGGGETGCDGDPRCVACNIPRSSQMRILCCHGSPTRVATFPRRMLVVILVTGTLGPSISMCVWVALFLASRRSVGCVGFKTYRIVHRRACPRNVYIALGEARGGRRRRGLYGEFDGGEEERDIREGGGGGYTSQVKNRVCRCDTGLEYRTAPYENREACKAPYTNTT